MVDRPRDGDWIAILLPFGGCRIEIMGGSNHTRSRFEVYFFATMAVHGWIQYKSSQETIIESAMPIYTTLV
jgi:hypothetical protein